MSVLESDMQYNLYTNLFGHAGLLKQVYEH
ncbi:hypothetical protein J2X77_001871 [Sphingobacterium sp. 2149]|uniref:Uncharacterized protein n=1 Tax=Sphingobacterium zeae TaxID=1776859 RepID=A0ABU0UAS1_9SPHI|nr:hypothetical protein [Sphingobacterium zeae]MDR6735005.1 hypothetical protein [Sphingobacterium sp. 2149]